MLNSVTGVPTNMHSVGTPTTFNVIQSKNQLFQYLKPAAMQEWPKVHCSLSFHSNSLISVFHLSSHTQPCSPCRSPHPFLLLRGKQTEAIRKQQEQQQRLPTYCPVDFFSHVHYPPPTPHRHALFLKGQRQGGTVLGSCVPDSCLGG